MIDILAHTITLILIAYYGAQVYAANGRGQRLYDQVSGWALIFACYMCAHCILYAAAPGALLWLVAGILFGHGWRTMQERRTGWQALNARAVAA